MATPIIVKVFSTPEGWKPPTKKQWHGTKWIEWDVPEKIHSKLCKMIEKEIISFEKTCPCERCKEKRSKTKYK